MTCDFGWRPKTDPSELLRLRDSIYAADLLVAAVAWLDFFSWLSGNPSDQAGICSGLQIEHRPADVMLTLLAAMKLIEERDGKYYLTEVAKEHLASDSSWNLTPYLETMRERPTCKDMLQVLRSGRPCSWGSKKDEQEWALAMEREEVARRVTAAMDSRGAHLAPAMAEELRCSRHEALLDVAGGSGIYACTIAARNDHLKAAVLEKPPVDRIAEDFVAKKGLAQRVSVIAGDMFEGLPLGYDLHLFSNVLHDWGEEAVRRLLTKSFEALPAGGEIVIHDAHIDEDKRGPLPVAEYSVLLMYSTEGKCYSLGEIRDLLEGNGFVDIRFLPTMAYWSLIRAQKPR
jgi:hypothetical protein